MYVSATRLYFSRCRLRKVRTREASNTNPAFCRVSLPLQEIYLGFRCETIPALCQIHPLRSGVGYTLKLLSSGTYPSTRPSTEIRPLCSSPRLLAPVVFFPHPFPCVSLQAWSLEAIAYNIHTDLRTHLLVLEIRTFCPFASPKSRTRLRKVIIETPDTARKRLTIFIRQARNFMIIAGFLIRHISPYSLEIKTHAPLP
ncbi:hypothetical protein BDN70DRAFT_689730 [Pholiota conissans]|uniref:Uncharacterized protein n=1 Tax=Pholiota conissans TaxID=109636 RepID=A0A9P6CTJ4_9AGAR|nr:hypothetical protein BDN70DRAFT_689730 [Pholiota conissans]